MKHPSRTTQRGMTLIELMVALTVGLFLALAVTSLIVMTLGQQKTTATVNQRDQTVSLGIAQLDKLVRSAGSGISSAWNLGFFGCTIRAKKSNSVLPPSTMPAPFNNLSQLNTLTAAPIIIEKGAGTNSSDVLFVMSGSGSSGDVARNLKSLSGTTLALENVIGLKANDLLLVATTGYSDCYVTQVSSVTASSGSTPATTLTLGGAYHTTSAVGAAKTLQEVVDSKAAKSVQLGNTASSLPVLKLIGVGGGDVLYDYDLLQLKDSAPRPIADGISHLFALYGVDTDQDGKVDSWVDPGSAGWSAADVKASGAKASQILAIRIALVTHTRDVRQAGVSAASIDVFADLGSSLKRSITLTTAQQADRYRVTDAIIPIRNNLSIK